MLDQDLQKNEEKEDNETKWIRSADTFRTTSPFRGWILSGISRTQFPLVDLLKGAALPKNGKNLIYLAANTKRRCHRRPGEPCSTVLMCSLSSCLWGLAVSLLGDVQRRWMACRWGRINKSQPKQTHTRQRANSSISNRKTIIYRTHLSMTLKITSQSREFIYGANSSLHLKRCYSSSFLNNSGSRVVQRRNSGQLKLFVVKHERGQTLWLLQCGLMGHQRRRPVGAPD